MTIEDVKKQFPFVSDEQAYTAVGQHEAGWTLDSEGSDKSINIIRPTKPTSDMYDHFYIRHDGMIRPC